MDQKKKEIQFSRQIAENNGETTASQSLAQQHREERFRKSISKQAQ
jgi:hypothetical protein